MWQTEADMRSYDVIVVGGGASGLMAAISASHVGARAAVLEHMEQAGKKLLSTGNGKCNFTNQMQGVEYYRGCDPAFVLPAMEQFGLAETLDFFQEMGIWWKEMRGGCIYPANGQASAVREALLAELRLQGVVLHCGVGIRSIKKERNRFVFDTKQGVFYAGRCVLATGGKAARKTGSDGSGIPYVVGFGHRVADFVPALVQMKGNLSFFKDLAGIRADGTVSLYVENEKICEDTGEIQLTEFGVSGIPAFQVSRYATLALQKGQEVFALLDFMPRVEEAAILHAFERQRIRCPQRAAVEWLGGMVNGRLAHVLLRQAGLQPQIALSQMKEGQLRRLLGELKALRVPIVGSKSFDDAQVCAGGVRTEEVCARTMESCLVPGLYFAGELLDIDGMCGGYNLQWAWSSGWAAGYHSGMARRTSGNAGPERVGRAEGGKSRPEHAGRAEGGKLRPEHAGRAEGGKLRPEHAGRAEGGRARTGRKGGGRP